MSDSAALPPLVLADQPRFTLGSLRIDPPLRTISLSDHRNLQVEPRVMQVLVALHDADGAVVSRAALNARCWAGRLVSDDALDRVIAKLRRLLAEASNSDVCVITVPRVGFRIAAPDDDGFELPSSDPLGVLSAVSIDRRALIAGGLGVTGVAAAGGYLWLHRNRPSAAALSTLVAVLGFQNLSPKPTTGFLASATSRQIRDQLARVAGLRLIAEPSSRSVAAQQLGWQEAGKRLGARYLVDGSVSEAGDQLRITATVVDVVSGSALWTDSFRGRSAELFALQDMVSGAVLRELIGRIGLDPASVPPVRLGSDSRAFRLTLEARDLLETSRTSRMEGATKVAFDAADRAYLLARDALAVDPRNVDALLLIAQLTKSGWTRTMTAEPLTADQRVTASIGFVTRALAIDPNDASALTALGDYYRRYQWRWAEAEALFRRALAANPSLVEAHWSYGYQLGVVGRCVEGLRHAQAVFDLDPETTWRRVALPRLLYLVGRREEAFARYAIELAATPANLFLITEIYLIHLSESRPDRLDALVSRVKALNGTKVSPALHEHMARLTAAATALRGDCTAFITRVDRDVSDYDNQQPGPGKGQGRADIDLLYIYAMEYAWGGEHDKALALLERALEGKSLYWPATIPYGPAPFPAALRREPRFKAIWISNSKLADLLRQRRRGLEQRQMAGYRDDGRFIRPT